jgi:hypothetical protein
VLVTYKPEDGDEQRWEFDFQRVRRSEAIIIEKAYGAGRTYVQFQMAAMQGSVEALTLLLWMLQRRDHPALRLEDVPDFYVDEIELDFGAAEWRAMRDEVAKSDDPQTAAALGVVAEKLAEAEAREQAAGEGKAISNSEDTPA